MSSVNIVDPSLRRIDDAHARTSRPHSRHRINAIVHASFPFFVVSRVRCDLYNAEKSLRVTRMEFAFARLFFLYAHRILCFSRNTIIYIYILSSIFEKFNNSRPATLKFYFRTVRQREIQYAHGKSQNEFPCALCSLFCLIDVSLKSNDILWKLAMNYRLFRNSFRIFRRNRRWRRASSGNRNGRRSSAWCWRRRGRVCPARS